MNLFVQKWLYSGKSGCYSSKSGCIRAKVVIIGKRWLNSAKVVVIRQSCCSRAIVVIFGQKWF